MSVIVDDDWPDVGTNDPLRQIDTFHNGDQNDEDWVGFSFSLPRRIIELVFQEGIHFATGLLQGPIIRAAGRTVTRIAIVLIGLAYDAYQTSAS